MLMVLLNNLISLRIFYSQSLTMPLLIQNTEQFFLKELDKSFKISSIGKNTRNDRGMIRGRSLASHHSSCDNGYKESNSCETVTSFCS